MVKSGHGFEIISSKQEYKNPFFKIIKHIVKRPNGVKSPYWTVSRFSDFSIIIPIFQDDTTMLVGQYRLPVGEYSWEFPMGQVMGKNPIETAKQELKEETGIKAKSWELIGHYYLAPGHHEQQVDIYIARELTVGKSEPEENEFLETKKVKISELGEMIKDGKIKDGPTIVAFHYLENYI